jgi:large subunit ribosomal protein L19e
MASEILKCGTNRIRIKPSKDVEEALTREDVRNLIRKGMIRKIPKNGSSRAAARKNLAQKKKGRRKGMGSRKGGKRSRISRKKEWMIRIKTLRKVIKELRDTGRIERKDYRKLYLRAKGGMFRNKKHIMLYVKEHELLKKPTKPIIKKVKPAKPAAAKKPAKPTKKTETKKTREKEKTKKTAKQPKKNKK